MYGSTPALLPTLSSFSKSNSSSSLSTSVTEIQIHPIVILSILDHQSRRPEHTSRVIGTLLGQKTSNTTIEITNSFAVPHAERNDEVAIGKDFNRQMLALQMRASNRKEAVVGWYGTSLYNEETKEYQRISDTSVLIHEFYAGECVDENPIHLVIDTSLQANNLVMKAYVSMPLMVNNEALGNVFHEIMVNVKMTESEKICVHRMISSEEKKEDDEQNEKESLLQSLEGLNSVLENTSDYVRQVIDGKITPNEKVGRELADTLSSIPAIRKDLFDKVFNDTLSDLMMVSYLSHLTKTQVGIAEKLNSLLIA